MVVAAAGAIAGVLLGTSPHHGATPVPSAAPLSAPRSTAPLDHAAPAALNGYTIVYTGSKGVRSVAFGGHGESDLPTGPASRPVQAAGDVVFMHAGNAYVLVPPFSGPPRALASGEALFPMLWPDMVGVVSGVGPGGRTIRFVDVDTGVTSDTLSWFLPPGYEPVSQFLVAGPGGALRSWSAGHSGSAELGPVLGHAGAVLGASSTEVAWLAAAGCAAGGECPLHLTATGSSRSDRTVPPAPGRAGFLPGGALSPDGRLLATFVAAPAAGRGQAELAIVDTENLTVTVVAASAVAAGPSGATAQWTPDGLAVFFCGHAGSMHVYWPGDARAITLGLPASNSFTLG